MYQFVIRQMGNWKLYSIIIVIWLLLRQSIMNILVPYINNFNQRLLVALGITVVISLGLMYIYEKYFDMEKFETTYPRDQELVESRCEDACQKISSIDKRENCLSECQTLNFQI